MEPRALHFRHAGPLGSFWNRLSPPVLYSVFTGSLAFAARILPTKPFPQPQVHILIAEITVTFAAEDIK